MKNKRILGYRKFFEEVTIKGNPGIPGEDGRRPGDKDYLRDMERNATDRLGVRANDMNQMMIYGRQIMELIGRSQMYVRGNEEALGQLAEDVIRHFYEDVLDGITLDIKIATEREIADNLKNDEESDEEMEIPTFQQLKDENIINKIHKAKIANVITQGEAKNTKHILHMDFVKDGLKEIYGNRWEAIFNIWVETTDVADKMDWIIPIEAKSNMMERTKDSGQGFAGSVNVEWKPPSESKEGQLEEEEETDEVDVLNPGEEDLSMGGYVPVIKARGIDFPMLLHETVKGIYELLSAAMQPSEGDASPEDVETWQTVMLNVSSFEDEAEDFRTGPEIAADLRDFINSIEGSDFHPNMREYVYAKMIDINFMGDREFLEFFRGILNGTDEARRIMKEIIDEVTKDLTQYDYDMATDGWKDDYEDNEEDYYSTEYDDTPDYDNLGIEPPMDDDMEALPLDYNEMSDSQLNQAMMDAIDREDYEEAAKIRDIINNK